MAKIRLAAFTLLCSTYIFSQGEYIIKINREDGSFVKVGPAVEGVTYIYPDDMAFDEGSRIFYFTSALQQQQLCGINTSKGSLVSRPVFNSVSYFQFSNTSRKMFALGQNTIANVTNFVEFDPFNGSTRQLGNPFPGSSRYAGNFSTMNDNDEIYIVLHTDGNLYSINSLNGNIILSPHLNVAKGENVYCLAYDNSSDNLYGLLTDASSQKHYLVLINTKTGNLQKIGNGTTLSAGDGSAAIDEANQQFMHLYSNTKYLITTMDLKTGNVIYNSEVHPLSGRDNAFSLRYDNKHGELYSIHWEDKALVPDADYNDEISDIYPNPAIDKATLEYTNTNNGSFTFTLHDARGRLVMNYSNITTDFVDIERNSLASGLYFYQLRSQGQTVKKGKLVFD